MLELLAELPKEPIFKLIAEHRDDPRPEKVDLGVGVYRDVLGTTPIMASVRKAEQWLLDTQASKAYLGSRGDIAFCAAIEKLIFADTVSTDRVYTLQTPGASGALRVAADLVFRANPESTLWACNPTWENHIPLLSGSGLNIQEYPYYDADQRELCFSAMLEALRSAKAGDLVLLHACCHNPSGYDFSHQQWQELADFLVEKQLVPLIDFAYHGFANGLDEDAWPVRLMLDRMTEMFVAYSCSKNFGLYRDRVGAISIVSDKADLAVIDGQAQNVVRTMYSVPPDHGSAVVAHILTDAELCAEWQNELTDMRTRMKEMREALAAALKDTAPDSNFSQIEKANGMFCILGVSAEQVTRLKRDFGIYLVDTSRINVCGITNNNVQYLAESITAAWR